MIQLAERLPRRDSLRSSSSNSLHNNLHRLLVVVPSLLLRMLPPSLHRSLLRPRRKYSLSLRHCRRTQARAVPPLALRRPEWPHPRRRPQPLLLPPVPALTWTMYLWSRLPSPAPVTARVCTVITAAVTQPVRIARALAWPSAQGVCGRRQRASSLTLRCVADAAAIAVPLSACPGPQRCLVWTAAVHACVSTQRTPALRRCLAPRNVSSMLGDAACALSVAIKCPVVRSPPAHSSVPRLRRPLPTAV